MADQATSDPNRRDFLYVATAAVGAVGFGAAAWPFIAQMNPDAAVLATATLEVDIAPVAVGEQLKVFWRGQPVFIRRRTPAEIEDAQKTPLADLKDPQLDSERVIQGKEEWLVMVGKCTHLGCVPDSESGDFGGWLCNCHGSHYDSSGRIRRGPAPKNMVVPEYAFLSDTLIRIG